jgi:hypothetical protein
MPRRAAPPACCAQGGDNCKEGYHGPLCTQCDVGWFRVAGHCIRCLPATYILLMLVVLSAAWFVLNVALERFEALNVFISFAQYVSELNNFNFNWPQVRQLACGSI